MMETNAKLAASDSAVYKHTFFGILNADGDFWTPLAFDAPEKAKQHIADFWRDPKQAAQCLRTHRVVPVRVQLTQLAQEPTS